MTVVPIQDDPDSPVQIDDIADALDRQIDLMWALIVVCKQSRANTPIRTPKARRF